MSVVILDNYDSFTYNLYQMVQGKTRCPVLVYRNDQLDWAGLKQLAPTHIILSPGPGHPGRAADFGLCQEVVTRHDELNCPILGVCLGHQGVAHYLGASVVPAPVIMHGKTSQIRLLRPSPLWDGLREPLQVMRYHSWMVAPESVPDELEVIAETIPAQAGEEPLIMALQHRTRPLFGVQFHPESVGTPQGSLLLENFLRLSVPLVKVSAS